MTFYLLLALCFLSFMIQGWFWHRFSMITVQTDPEITTQHSIPVSIVICAHNEAENLRAHLPMILTQDYLHYEVLVVDHGSVDKTPEILNSLERKYPKLKYQFCQYRKPGKRPALAMGIKACKYNCIVVTDADCTPASPRWLAQMIAPFATGADIVLGAAPLRDGHGTLSAFARIESAYTYIQYATATEHDLSYMGVGRNMAYTKETYLEQDPNKFGHYLGGDDDLLVSEAASAKVVLVTNPSAHVLSNAPKNWQSFYRQKRRHVSVSWSYSLSVKLLLMAYAGSHWLILFLVLFALFFHPILGAALFLLLLLRGIYVKRLLYRVAPHFVRPLTTLQILIADFYYILHYPVVALYLILKHPSKW